MGYICMVVVCTGVENDVIDLVHWTDASKETGKTTQMSIRSN